MYVNTVWSLYVLVRVCMYMLVRVYMYILIGVCMRWNVHLLVRVCIYILVGVFMFERKVLNNKDYVNPRPQCATKARAKRQLCVCAGTCK